MGSSLSKGGGPHAYLRETIQDDFLNENDDVDEEESNANLQASIESGEIQAMFGGKDK